MAAYGTQLYVVLRTAVTQRDRAGCDSRVEVHDVHRRTWGSCIVGSDGCVSV